MTTTTTAAAATASRVDRVIDRAIAACEGQEMTVTRKGEVLTFVSNLSDAEAVAALAGMRSSFAQSLYRSRNRLSAKQLAWAHYLASESQTRQSASEDPAAPSQFEALFAAFQAARDKGAKRLTLRFAGVNVKPNRDNTALWITSQSETEEGRYGRQPKYLGKVIHSGMDSRLTDDVKAVLMEAARDPLTAAIRYGKQSGACSCCGRELTDPRSIQRGIGPICATKFGW